jgi:hypothetical protein
LSTLAASHSFTCAHAHSRAHRETRRLQPQSLSRSVASNALIYQQPSLSLSLYIYIYICIYIYIVIYDQYGGINTFLSFQLPRSEQFQIPIHTRTCSARVRPGDAQRARRRSCQPRHVVSQSLGGSPSLGRATWTAGATARRMEVWRPKRGQGRDEGRLSLRLFSL